MKILNFNIQSLKIHDPKVLDVGCGQGWILKEAVMQGALGIGIDISSEQLSKANDVLREFPKSRALLLQSEVSHIPFLSESMDLVICCETLEHIHNPQELLREIYRILAPRGWVILSVPVKRVEQMLTFFCRHFLEFSGHVRQFSLRDMKELLSRAGLETAQVQRRYFEWSFFYFWMAVFDLIPKVDRRGNQYGMMLPDEKKQERLSYYYKRVWAKLIRWKIGIPILWAGNFIFPKSYFFLAQKG